MKYKILDAARLLRHLIAQAGAADLNAAYQQLANEANSSDYAHTHEPMSGLCVAIEAEFARRLLSAKSDSREDEEDEAVV